MLVLSFGGDAAADLEAKALIETASKELGGDAKKAVW